ncbi:Mitochondrial import receptor subunit TOM70, partial [Trachymyrmex septentrionalis]
TPLQTAQKYKNAGNVRFKLGKYNEAIAEYNKAIDICPKENVEDLAIFYQNRAAAYEQLKRYNSVKADCTKALELNPKYVKALLRRARILEQLGDFEAALKDITIACIHENFSDQVSLLKADMILEKLVEQHFPKKLTDRIDTFFLMPTMPFIEINIRSFSKDPILSRLEYPENIPEFIKKPLQALKNREYHNIISLCTEIIESPKFDILPPSKLEVLLLRATFYLIWQNYDAAIHDLKVILSSEDVCDDIRVNALIKRAIVYIQIEIPEMAFKDFELALIINPSCSDIYYYRGVVYKEIRELSKAKHDFEKAVEYNPNFSMAHMQKWYANYQFALLTENIYLIEITVRDVEKALNKYSNSPECVCCYVLYAEMMFRIQQYQKADTYFVKAIEKDPDYAIDYFLLWNCNLIYIEKYVMKALKSDKCSVEGKLRGFEVLRIIEITRGNIEEVIKLIDMALTCCRTFKELLYMYSESSIKICDIKLRFTQIVHFLRSYSQFIDIQNAEESDKHISIDSDGPSKVLSPVAESETSLQKAQKYENEGNIYFKTEKYNEAIAQYTKAINICPKENKDKLAIFYQSRAAAYEQLKKYSSVKADCTKALELNPKNIKAMLCRARVLERTGDLEAALKDMTTVCIYEEFSYPTSLIKVEIILKKLVKQHTYENWANKKLLMPNKLFIECYIISYSKDPVFSKLRCPENIPEFFKKPLQALKDTKYDDVIPLCTEIIESPEFNTLPSTKLEVLLLRATFYSLLGKSSSAFQDLECILNIEYASDDVKINALLKMAGLYLKFMDDLNMAFINFELAININPHYSDIYYHRGQTYMHMGKLNKAKHDFEKALEYNPNFSMACIQKCYTDYRIAMLNKDVRLVEAAVRAFEKVFEKYTNLPEYAFCYQYYCKMMSETRQYQKAHIYFTKIIKKYPKDTSMSSVYLQRACLQFDWSSNSESKAEYLKKAIELDEKCSFAYKLLGIVEMKKGNIEETIRLFDKALVYCRTIEELLHLYLLRDTARIELNIKNQFGKKYFGFFSRYLGLQLL